MGITRKIEAHDPAMAADSLLNGKAVRDPTGNCTGCHTLTTLQTGTKFALDAVGRVSSVNQDETDHRTDWALRSGAGQIHPWMVPRGNDLSGNPPPLVMTDAEWAILETCLSGAGGPECDAKRLYTACPAPRSPQRRF